MSSPDFAIETAALTKRFGDLVAVDSLDLRIRRGTFAGFLGPNGAGKTTTFRMLVGLLRPTSGTAAILGHDVAREPVEVKRRIGVVLDEPSLFDYLTPVEFLSLVGGAFGLDHRTIGDRTTRLLDLLTLGDHRGALCRELSHGMRKKLELAAALLHDPEVFLLDEPLSGIDPIDARVVKDVLRSVVQRGATVLLSSHVLETVEAVCDEVIILDHGRLISQGTVAEVRASVHAESGSSLESVFLALVDPGRERPVLW